MKDRSEIHVIVHLFAGSGGLAGLQEFENKALPILQAHQGELLLAFNPVRESVETPDEIHYLKFPSSSAFDGFKHDDRHKDLANERAVAISRTEIYVSNPLVKYPYQTCE